jgi:hypothetical protein
MPVAKKRLINSKINGDSVEFTMREDRVCVATIGKEYIYKEK